MKLKASWILMACTLVMALPTQAQQGGSPTAPETRPGRGMMRGQGMNGPFNRMYDQETVTTVTGTVEALEQVASGRGRGMMGVHLTLNTDQGPRQVHLGPRWFLDTQTVKISKGDAVEVTGSRITYEGRPAIIARSIKKGGQTLELREASGVPLWAGRGRGRRAIGGGMDRLGPATTGTLQIQPDRYDPSKVEKVTGIVEKVEKVPSPRSTMGVHLLLKTQTETIPVHLGPDWFIDRFSQNIAKGDQLTIEGSRVQMAGKDVIIAASVNKGGETLKLRDDHGVPFWAGWRKP